MNSLSMFLGGNMRKKKKTDIISLIEETLNEIKDLVIKSGVQEGQFAFALKQAKLADKEYQEIILSWLLTFKNAEYKIVKDTLAQFSGWDNYKLYGINNLPEQALLRKRQKALRLAWHGRPRPKKEKKNEDVQNVQEAGSEQNPS